MDGLVNGCVRDQTHSQTLTEEPKQGYMCVPCAILPRFL